MIEDPWRIAAELRDLALTHMRDAPKYLLAYEVAAVLSFIDDYQQRMLIELMFHCGGRVSEMLSLTPADLALETARPFVALRTLKQRQRTKGRPKKDDPAKRLVPLLDQEFVPRLRQYLKTFSQGRNKAIWPVSAQTVRNWLAQAEQRAQAQGVHFAVRLTPHVLRHSFSMHLLLWGRIHMKRLQAYLGHSSPRSTDCYTALLSLDATVNEAPLSFSVPVSENPLLQHLKPVIVCNQVLEPASLAAPRAFS